jgi:hypothetical protein
MVDVESVFYSFELWFVSVVELKEVGEVGHVWEYLIIPQEMHNMLVDHSKFLLFIFLLIFNNEIVEENLIQLIKTLLNGKFDPLNGGGLILIQRQIFGIVILNDIPQLFEIEATQRWWGVALFCL